MGEEIQKCPRCGRPFKALIPGVGRQFECATIVLPVGGHAEGMPCVMRQRDQLATEIQTLRTANAALVERVKRLEEAGRALAKRHLPVVVTYPQAQADVAEYEKAIQ